MGRTSRDAAQRLELLVETLDDLAIAMLDKDGRIIAWNGAAERLTGYRFSEVEGDGVARLVAPDGDAADEAEATLDRALQDGKVELEGWRTRKDGRRFWGVSTFQPMRNDDGQLVGFAVTLRDLTAQHAAHHALIESERRFRYLVEGVVDYAIYMLDVNGTVTNWNRGAARIKGYPADEIIGRHFSLFYTPEDRRAGGPARALETALKEGRFEAEGWRVRKDGTRFWASVVIDAIHDDDGQHIGYAKITRDISEARAAQESLAESERQFRMLVAGVTDYALFMLDPNGIVASWNAGAERIKGYSADEIIGRHVSTFYTATDRHVGLPLRALRTAAETGRFEAEGWRVRKDGSLFWAAVVIDAIREETGELVGFAKITRDITERRDAQIELQKANERMAQAQKLEAIGQLTGGVAHDFNNLLMVVGGHAQLLRRKVGDSPGVAQALDAIESAASRGRDLTRHLLAFARRQRLNPTRISLHERADSIRELLSASVGSTIELNLDLPASLWPVRIDAGELELALLNMAVNARDAMPSGGSLTIRGENLTLDRGEVDADLKGDFVAVTVSDTGQGIPPDILARVFEPFFTTKDVDKGTGLGLAQVYGFVQQSGGHVTVTSELGKGTRVILYLPRAAASTAADEVVEAPAAAAPEDASVLVVDDNPEVARVAAGLFELLGNRTVIAGNAAEALRLIEANGAPDLVFADIVMAGEMDGLSLARHLRKVRPELPILLATGYSRQAENIAGEFPVLTKPYELSDLSRAVGALLSDSGAGGAAKRRRATRAKSQV